MVDSGFLESTSDLELTSLGKSGCCLIFRGVDARENRCFKKDLEVVLSLFPNLEQPILLTTHTLIFSLINSFDPF